MEVSPNVRRSAELRAIEISKARGEKGGCVETGGCVEVAVPAFVPGLGTRSHVTALVPGLMYPPSYPVSFVTGLTYPVSFVSSFMPSYPVSYPVSSGAASG